MSRIKKIENIVLGVLERYPESRDSDETLYYEIIKDHEHTMHYGFSVYELLMERKKWGIPSYETVGRTRRKLQEEHEELRGSKWATRYRREEEERFIAYARGEEEDG